MSVRAEGADCPEARSSPPARCRPARRRCRGADGRAKLADVGGAEMCGPEGRVPKPCLRRGYAPRRRVRNGGVRKRVRPGNPPCARCCFRTQRCRASRTPSKWGADQKIIARFDPRVPGRGSVGRASASSPEQQWRASQQPTSTPVRPSNGHRQSCLPRCRRRWRPALRWRYSGRSRPSSAWILGEAHGPS